MNTKPITCPREYDVDEFWLVQKPPEHPMAVHLKQCELCRSALDSYSTVEREFEEEVFPATIEKVERRALSSCDSQITRGKLVQLAVVIVPLAAAAMLAFIVLFPAGSSDEIHPDEIHAYVGEKGDFGFEVYCRRGEKVFQLREGDTIFEEDSLRFSPVLSAKRAYYGMVVSINESGGIHSYFPLNGSESVKLKGGEPLPGSVIMDDSHGTERLFFLVSDERFTFFEVKNAVDNAFENSGKTTIPHRLPINLEQVSIGFQKENRR